MSRLYEINNEIARVQERIEWNDEHKTWVDLDTGEMLSDEEMDALFSELQMSKREVLVWMAKCVLNDRSEALAIREEEKRLAVRRKRFEKRAERFESIIDRECNGVNTDLEVATMKYTMGHPLDFPVEKEGEIIRWLEENGHGDCVKVEKEVRKTETKKLINSGVAVPDCRVIDRKSPSLK